MISDIIRKRITLAEECHIIERLSDREYSVLLGYMRVSKADGSQTTDIQRDAMITAGVSPDLLY